ncbi:MAG TPA: hypothetical protein VGE31_02185 [Candidatus Paceibacterota bacterium]
MLYVFFGTDRTAVRNAAQKVSETIGSPTIIDETAYAPGAVASAAQTASLFGGTEIFIIDTPSDDDTFEAEVIGSVAALKESQNTFVIMEHALLADVKKKYGKYAERMEEFSATKAERFNTFALADALAKRDKKNLWVLLAEAQRTGIRSEELVGILWWQLKTMRLANVTRSAADAGMKDFPYNKAKRALGLFKEGEVESLSRSLLALYHHAHQGTRDMDLALEEWVLRI